MRGIEGLRVGVGAPRGIGKPSRDGVGRWWKEQLMMEAVGLQGYFLFIYDVFIY